MGCINIPLLQGNPKTITIELTDDNDDPIDLSTFDLIKMRIRGALGNTNHADVVKTIGNGLSYSGTDNNKLEISFTNETYQWVAYSLKYDILFVRSSDNTNQHWFKGIINVTPTITTPQQS